MEIKEPFRPERYMQLVVTSVKEETEGVKTFTLARPDGQPVAYKAGQFLTFVFDRHGVEERRSFSLSGSPALYEPASITLKRVDNGAWSRYMVDKAKAGDILYATEVSGIFTLPEDMSHCRQVFFFAAGIGITPVFSLLKTLLYTTEATQAILFYSSRTEKQTVFFNELQELLKKFPGRLHVAYLFSTSFNLLRARLSKSLLPVLLQEHRRAITEETLFYLCGPYPYMRMVLLGLEEQGIPAGNIRKENFDTLQRAPKAEPPDKRPHKVTLIKGREQFEITVRYPDTILRAARKQGITLPYSCDAGRCASCVALCRQGQVWLSYNEVLTDADIASGKTLTCTGHPVGGDVVLEV